MDKFWKWYIAAIVAFILFIGWAIVVSTAYDECVETNSTAFCVATLGEHAQIYAWKQIFGSD